MFGNGFGWASTVHLIAISHYLHFGLILGSHSLQTWISSEFQFTCTKARRDLCTWDTLWRNSPERWPPKRRILSPLCKRPVFPIEQLHWWNTWNAIEEQSRQSVIVPRKIADARSSDFWRKIVYIGIIFPFFEKLEKFSTAINYFYFHILCCVNFPAFCPSCCFTFRHMRSAAMMQQKLFAPSPIQHNYY